MPISVQRPSEQKIQTFLNRQEGAPFSYLEVGQTQDVPPSGYNIDHNRIQLGYGRAVYEKAQISLCQWQMFNLDWVEICWPDTPIVAGMSVGILAQVFGFWTLNACRIVYRFDETDETTMRFGFGYGTLPAHLERGEERFSIEWNHADDSVWYDILAFSRPNHLLTKMGYPVARYFQKRFAQGSKQVMYQIINEVESR